MSAICSGSRAAHAEGTEATDSQQEPAVTEDARALARQRFIEGREAYEEGDYREAARLFEEAYRLSPHASAMFNAAIAWDGAQELARAADAYEMALDLGGLTAEQATEASTRLAALKKALGYVRVLEPVGATASVAHLDRVTIPVRLHVAPGSHTIRIDAADGRSATRTVVVRGGEVVTPKLAFAPVVTEPTPVRPAPRPPPSDQTALETRGGEVWGWVALGGGVALSAAAIVLGLNALDARDDFEASGRADRNAHDRASTLRILTNVAWAGAALSGGTGLYLVLSSPSVRF